MSADLRRTVVCRTAQICPLKNFPMYAMGSHYAFRKHKKSKQKLIVNSNTFSPYCLFKCLAFPNYVLSNLTFMLGKEIGELCEALYAKILCSLVKDMWNVH